jgi:hypothetical protein
MILLIACIPFLFFIVFSFIYAFYIGPNKTKSLKQEWKELSEKQKQHFKNFMIRTVVIPIIIWAGVVFIIFRVSSAIKF